MRKLLLVVVFLVLIIAGCSESSISNSNKDATKIDFKDITNSNKDVTKIDFTDITTSNKDSVYGHDIKDGNVQIAIVKPHSGSISANAYFKGWKPYDKIEVYRQEDVLKIYYTEKNTDKTENVFISFILGFHAYEGNTEVYKNGVLQKDNVKCVQCME